MRNRLVAIIDDDIIFSRRLATRLGELGFETIIVNSGLELLSVLSIDRPGFIIVDMMLNWVDPMELINSFRKNSDLKDIKVFLVTEQKPDESSVDKGNFADEDIIYKSVDCDHLINRLREEIYSDESTRED